MTSSAADADTYIEDMGIMMSRVLVGGYALHWQSGGSSQMKNVKFLIGYAPANWENIEFAGKDFPFVVVANNGGGRWYNFHNIDARSQLPGYRHLLITDVKGPFRMYQCNPEHSSGDYNLEIQRSENVTIYGMKAENSGFHRKYLSIKDSNNISVFGYGGNAQGGEDSSLIYINNSNNVTLAGVVDLVMRTLNNTADYTEWSMINENKNGNTHTTTPMDRPILYKN